MTTLNVMPEGSCAPALRAGRRRGTMDRQQQAPKGSESTDISVKSAHHTNGYKYYPRRCFSDGTLEFLGRSMSIDDRLRSANRQPRIAEKIAESHECASSASVSRHHIDLATEITSWMGLAQCPANIRREAGSSLHRNASFSQINAGLPCN